MHFEMVMVLLRLRLRMGSTGLNAPGRRKYIWPLSFGHCYTPSIRFKYKMPDVKKYICLILFGIPRQMWPLLPTEHEIKMLRNI